MENLKRTITYDGLKQFPTHKENLNKWIDHLKKAVNSDSGHLSDMASCINQYSALFKEQSNELFKEFDKQNKDLT